MKVFRIVKKLFFIGLTILSNFTNASLLNAIPLNATALNCISMNQKLLMLTVIIPYFILLVLKQVNVVEWSIRKNLCPWYYKKFKR